MHDWGRRLRLKIGAIFHNSYPASHRISCPFKLVERSYSSTSSTILVLRFRDFLLFVESSSNLVLVFFVL